MVACPLAQAVKNNASLTEGFRLLAGTGPLENVLGSTLSKVSIQCLAEFIGGYTDAVSQ